MMKRLNRRKQNRFHSNNLISYVCLDADHQEWGQGIARTLDISQTGLKLESHEPLDEKLMVISIGIQEEIVDMKGKVIYCHRGDYGYFESGIDITHIAPQTFPFYKGFINNLEYRLKRQKTDSIPNIISETNESFQ